jgi:lambda family phage tail tape measure protein
MAMNMEAMLKITANVAGENNIRRLGNSMQGLEGRIKNASMATNLLYTGLKSLAAVAVTGGVVALAKSAIDLADDMRDLSQRTGVGVETLGQFKVAAELSGSSLEGVAKGLTFLNKNMVAAATGAEGAAAAFKTVGVATTEADGTLRSADKVFLDVADRFAQLRDGPEKAALAIKIFGKAGAELIPILNLGSKEIQRFGLGIGPDFADKADAFNDQLGIMKAQTTVLTVQIGSALLPVMSGLVSIIGDVVKAIGDLAKDFYVAIGGMAGLTEATKILTKTLLVFGGVAAGVFIVSNVVAFGGALRTVIKFSRELLDIEKRMLLLQTARAAIQGILTGAGAGATKGATPAQKIIGGVAGAGAGIAALIAVNKLIDESVNKMMRTIDAASNRATRATTPPGTTPDLSGLRTGAGTKPKKAEEMSQKLYQLELDLLEAQRKENETQVASIKYEIAQQKFAESKLKNRNDLVELAKAERQYMEDIADIATKTGAAVAQDFIKRNQLQEDYKRTVEELQIKAGLITGDKLKQVEIDRELQTILERLPGLTQAQIDKLKELVAASKQVKDGFGDTFGESLRQYYDSLKNFGGQVADSVKGAFQGLEDQLTSFVTTGKANFTDLANSIIADIARIAIRQAIIRPLVGGIFDIFNIKPSAMGNVFAQNGIQKFARGGIVDKPTMFPFAKGIGLMGEAGPEAIMPLRRGRDGRLGVQATNGGGGVSVVVNVDASGTSVQGDNAKGAEFGRAISEAVKNEIVIQKRPGGLLN